MKRFIELLKKDYPAYVPSSPSFSYDDLENPSALLEALRTQQGDSGDTEKEPKYYTEILATLREEGIFPEIFRRPQIFF
jgi:hypothetical protein